MLQLDAGVVCSVEGGSENAGFPRIYGMPLKNARKSP